MFNFFYVSQTYNFRSSAFTLCSNNKDFSVNSKKIEIDFVGTGAIIDDH